MCNEPLRYLGMDNRCKRPLSHVALPISHQTCTHLSAKILQTNEQKQRIPQ